MVRLFKNKWICCFSALLFLTNSISAQSPLAVTLNTDSNPTVLGELRYAINAANVSGGTITFNIPDNGSYSHTITLTASNGYLPAITQQVVIDGNSQPAYTYTGIEPRINISGINFSTWTSSNYGLKLSSGSDGSSIQNLCIRDFIGVDGIKIASDNNDVSYNVIHSFRFGAALTASGYLINISGAYNLIKGNVLGTNRAFSMSLPESDATYGIRIEGTGHNIIGGSGPGEGNIATNLGNSRSPGSGAGLRLSSSDYNKISHNLFYFSNAVYDELGLLFSSSNLSYTGPVISGYSSGVVSGTAAHAGDIIELFGANDQKESNEYLATVIAGTTSPYNWSATIGTSPWTHFNATATEPGITSPNVPNTSEFSSSTNPSPCPAAPVINAVSNICQGQTLSLSTPAAPSGFTYNWSGPNGFSSSLQNPSITSITTAASGNYTLTLSQSGGCTSSVSTASITVNTMPSAPLISAVSSICSGQNLTLSTASVSGVTYNWTGPNSFSSNVQNPVINAITIVGSGTYILDLSNGACTSAKAIAAITVNPIPATPTITTVTELCAGSTLNLSTATVSGATYSWTGPNSFASSSATPSITAISTSGSGTYTLTITQAGCSSAPATAAVVVHPSYTSAPVISSIAALCEGDNIQLSTAAVAEAVYSWTGPGGFTSSLQNPLITGATTAMSGTYSLTIHIGSCASPAGTFTITVSPIPPTPSIDPVSPICAGIDLHLTSPSVSGVTYNWTGPNGFSSNLQNPAITGATVAASGTYTLTLTQNGCQSAPATGTVLINPSPVLNASGSVCEGQNIYLGTPTPGSSYSWTGPNSFTSSLQNPVLLNATALMSGTYTLTVGTGTCNTASAGITVNSNPLGWAPLLTATHVTCKTFTISYVSSSGVITTPIVNAQWAFGDGTFGPATGLSISHTYPANGTYVVTLNGDNTGACSYSTVVIVDDIASPDFIYAYNDPCDISTGINLLITGFNSAYNYSWNINGHLVAAPTDNTIITSFLVPGPNTILLNVSNTTGCYSSVSKIINIGGSSPAFLIYTPDASHIACTGDLLVVSGVLSGGDNYHWKIEKSVSGGPVTTEYETPVGATEMMPTFVFNAPGNYVVTLTVTNNLTDASGSPVACVSSHQETVTVNQLPAALFTILNAGGACNGTITLVPPVNTAITAYSINYGDGTVLTGTTSIATGHLSHHYGSNGVFTVTFNVSNGACTASYSHNVAITNSFSLALVTPSPFLCTGTSLLIDPVLSNIPLTAGTITYSWNGPSGFTSALPQVNATTAGTYSLTVTSDGACTLYATEFVTITQLAEPTAIVVGGPVLISCSSTTTNATLQVSQALAKQGFCINGVCTTADPAAAGPVTTTVSGLIAGDNYITIANGRDHSCSGVILIHVEQDLPTVSISITQPGDCTSDGSAIVTSSISAGNTKWYTTAGYPSSSFHTGNSVSALIPGGYVAEVTDGYCKVTRYFTIALPVINVSLVNSNPATCSGGTVSVTLNIGTSLSGLTYVWKKKDLAGIYQAHSGSTISEDLEPGEYEVTVSAGGCSSVIYFQVKTYDPIAVNFDVELPGCNATGHVIALTSGGDGNYNYTWTLGGTTMAAVTNPLLSLSGVSSSTTVQVLVNDGSGCSATYPASAYAINPPAGITLDNCGGNQGTLSPMNYVTITDCDISVCVTGGVPPYNFEWIRIGDKESTLEHFFTTPSGVLTNDQGGAVTAPASTQAALDAILAGANANNDGDPATSLYPYWDFTGSSPVPVYTTTGVPHSVMETIITPNSEFYITSYSGGTAQVANNGDFVTGEYKVKVTDANGCSYLLDVGHLDFLVPTGFKVGFSFVWGFDRKVAPPVAEADKVDEILAESMAEAADEMLDAADKCKEQQGLDIKDALASSCSNLTNFHDEFRLDYNITEHQYTLYYYDRAGQLTKTIPPEGVELLSTSEIADVIGFRKGTVGSLPGYDPHRMPSTYQYNSMGQLISQNTPDGGTSNFIYDGKGRLRFSQNPQQLATGNYSYTRYDGLGRITEVGESSLAGLTFGSTDPATIAANLSDANLDTYPSSGNRQVTHTVYSDAAPTSVTYYGRPQQFLQNRVSYVYIDADPSIAGDEYYTYYSYDSHGNVEWLIQQDAELGKNFIAYEYDLISGKVLKVKYNEHRLDRFFHRYSYDVENRLTKVETSRDGELWDNDASYKYYPHGPLQRNELGEDHVQGLDNIYTIEGWIKAINTPHLNVNDDPGADNRPATASAWETSQTARDRFGMVLNYYRGDYTRSGNYLDNSISAAAPVNIGVNDLYAKANDNTAGSPVAPDLYNGNISSWIHSQLDQVDPTASAPKAARADLFKYDVLNRIKQNIDLEQSGTTWASVGTGVNAANTYKTDYTYDGNGNILTLNRFDQAGDQMDNLSYTYDNGSGIAADSKNRLRQVNEGGSSNTVDGRGDLEGAHNYDYDYIGNLITDVSQERLANGGVYGLHTVTTHISWTVYGKIGEITKDIDFSGTIHKEKISFAYDASGNRTMKKVWRDAGSYNASEDDDEMVTTYYVRDAQGNVLSVYEKQLYPATSTDPEMFKYKLIEQPLYGSDRIGQNIKDVTLSSASTLGGLLPPGDAMNTLSEYENWITTTNNSTLLPGGNDKLCECKIMELNESTTTPVGKYSQVTTAAEFLGVAENGIAVAENLEGNLQFFVVLAEKYLGNNDVCLVYDQSGKLMKGTELIGGIDVKSKPVIVSIPGGNKYAIVNLNSAKQPVYQVVDMDMAGYGTTPLSGALTAGEVIAVDLPMTNYTGTAPAHGWHFTAYEDHINGKTVVYNTRYKADPADPIRGKTEILAYDFNSDYTIQPSEHVLYELNGCGKTETGELQISPQGNKLVWYQHDKNVSAFDHRVADVYTFNLSADKTAVLGTADYAAGTSQAGNYGEGRVEFMSNNNDLLFGQRGVYEESVNDQNRNTWKYEQAGNLLSLINPSVAFNPLNTVNPTITYLFSEIRRGIDGNYYMPDMGSPADQVHSYSGAYWNEDVATGAAANQFASALPTQVFKLFADPSQQISSYERSIGSKQYELKDHLGNVSVVISDEKIPVNGTNTGNDLAQIDAGDYFVPTILNFTDYYPFGAALPGRSFVSSGGYRYGFNGQEKDDEVAGSGNVNTAEYWEYDTRTGRRWNVDPMDDPSQSPYATFNNNPVFYSDPCGLKGEPTTTTLKGKYNKDSDKEMQALLPSNPADGEKIIFKHAEDTWEHTWEYSASTKKWSITSSFESAGERTETGAYSFDTKPMADPGFINLYNGIVRENYIAKTKALEPLYKVKEGSLFGSGLTLSDKRSNAMGMDLRLQYKTTARNNSIAGGKSILNTIEGEVIAKPPYSKLGQPTRFYSTRPAINIMSKASTAIAVVNVVVAVHRIATSKNPVRETTLVTYGLAGAYTAMTLAAPIAADIGLKLSAINPVLGITTAFLIEGAAGIAGSYFGEKGVGAVLDFFK